jgi:hypothetical protein
MTSESKVPVMTTWFVCAAEMSFIAANAVLALIASASAAATELVDCPGVVVICTTTPSIVAVTAPPLAMPTNIESRLSLRQFSAQPSKKAVPPSSHCSPG